jgi:hypothetical protein
MVSSTSLSCIGSKLISRDYGMRPRTSEH